MVSDEAASEAVVSGGSPDFEFSPDVLIWSKMFRGVVRDSGRPLFKPVAAFSELRVWTQYRLGIADKLVLVSHELHVRVEFHLHARILALFDCNVPMKCHRMS
jgi:hypothetical protein